MFASPFHFVAPDVVVEFAEKLGVVVRGLGDISLTAKATGGPDSAEEEPEKPTQNGKHDHDDEPHEFREGARFEFGCPNDIDDAIQVESDSEKNASNAEHNFPSLDHFLKTPNFMSEPKGKPDRGFVPGYGSEMQKSWMAWVTYTLIRIALLVAFWFVIQLLTPIRGPWAIALALMISAVFSIIFLGKQRDQMSSSVFGFFSKINERIEAGAAKEDALYSGDSAGESDSAGQIESSGHSDSASQSDTAPESEPVNQEQDPGGLQRGN